MAAQPPGMTDRLLGAMATSAARRYGAERVSELAHALQCAELAREAGADDELTLACLLHDVGRFAVDQALIFDRVGGARAGTRGHHEIGADLIAPYVSERVAWIVKVHPEFQQYYYAPHMGGVRDAREKYRDHPWFGDCVEFCEKYDQNCFDTQFEHRPLEFFLPMVEQIFAREPWTVTH